MVQSPRGAPPPAASHRSPSTAASHGQGVPLVANLARGAVVAGGALVGRERELEAVRDRLAAARAGHGGVIAVGGEPGIGKTSVAQAGGGLARAGGGIVLWGRCFEGEWAPPYGPWVEILSDLVASLDPERLGGLAAGLGPGAAALAALVPLLGAALPPEAAPAPLSAEEERFRLHEAGARLLLEVVAGGGGAAGPSLVVIDDLQWADRPTLALLLHLARLLEGARLVLLLTYRDGELGLDHPATEALAALRREAGFLPMTLRGLPREAVVELVGRAAKREIPPELGQAIHGETGGNPFYVREVTRHLLDEGALLGREKGAGGDVSIRELGAPEGVRQVVARRLARLSEPARRVLEGASLFTAGVDFPVLLAWTGQSEDGLLDALDEAIGAQFLRSTEGGRETYDFAHAIVRQVLVAEQARNPSRAARLHRRAAEALEAVQGLEPRGGQRGAAAELAIQYRASAGLPGAARGVAPALAAADQACAAFAVEQAVFFLRIARDLSDELDPGTRGGILSRLATAEAEALLLDEAEATTEQALAALRASETGPERIAAFLATLAAAMKLGGAPAAVWRPLNEHGLALVGGDRGLTWARLALLRDPVAPVSSDAVRAGRWLGFDQEAARAARLFGDEDDHARTIDSFDARDRDQTRALIDLARTWTRPTASLRVLSAAANDLQYRHGAFREALLVWQEVEGTARRSGTVSWQAQAVGQAMLLHLTLGDFERARAAEAEAAALLARLGPQGGMAGEPEELAAERATAFALALGGEWGAIAEAWRRTLQTVGADGNYVTTLNGPLFAALAAVAHARAGSGGEALRLVDALIPILGELDPARGNQAQNGTIAFAAEAVWLLGARERAAACKRLALAVMEAGVGDYPQTSNELTVARMAALRDEAGESRDYFERARGTLEAAGQRPLRAIVDHDEAVASLRLEPGERARPAALWEAAASAFAGLGMTEWAARASGERAALLGATGQVLPAGLSEREAEVLRLVARGQSDRQIADALFVSPRTVNAHVRNLLMKTERGNRTELSVWAVEHGLVESGNR